MQGERRKTQVAFLHAMNPATGAAREFALNPPECSVGSEESNDAVIHDSTVSRRHARLRLRGRKWQVTDGGSSNGTYVADHRVVEWTTLRDGQEVRFGGARFVFRSGDAAAAQDKSGGPISKRASRFRAVAAIVVTGAVIGFAVAQYFLYRSYQRRVAVSKPGAKGQPLNKPGSTPGKR